MALGRKTGGRKKGAPNKTTKALKELILDTSREWRASMFAVFLPYARSRGADFWV